jgi:hydroxymethylpyrimidine/phosphomethylpyrimidine kinase
MLFSTEIIMLVSAFLKQHARDIPIVLDPVMVAKSGDRLLQVDAVQALKDTLIPLVNLITPNLPEARALVPGVDAKPDLLQALLALGCQAVLLKGGHETSIRADDTYLSASGSVILSASRIPSRHTHGTGCTLSAAIASYMAQGWSSLDACKHAKDYLHGAIMHSKYCSVGKGHGPVHHFHHLWPYLTT